MPEIDRRWIFLLMLLAVAIPVLTGLQLPEQPTENVRDVFGAIESLPNGSRIWISYDYDPGSQGELQPMAAAFTRHCALKGHKLYYMSLWPQGGPMIKQSTKILTREFPAYEYGVDYVDLGYANGMESVIKNCVNDLRESYEKDAAGTVLNDLPIIANVNNIQQMDLIINVSAGDPGTKQWVQYAASPLHKEIIAGTTGVMALSLYSYIPQQLRGVLGGIKGAAEYEKLLTDQYPEQKENKLAQEGLRRMGPQLVAHVLMVLLIVAGNVVYFMNQTKGMQ